MSKEDTEKKYGVDVFTSYVEPWMEEYSHSKMASPYGTYFTFKCDQKEQHEIMKKARRHYIKTRTYELRWARSNDYRKHFFETHHPPYRCQYCGRWLNAKYMQVDHVVPVAQTKKSSYARWLLTRKGIQNVNDPHNLVPSCRKCNRKKSDKLGIWYIRAQLGYHEKWFGIQKFLHAVFVLLIIIFLIYLLK